MNRMKSAVRTLLRRFDIEVSRYTNSTRFKRVRMLDKNNITVVLDVGANAGHYGRELRTAGWTGRIVSFEPLTEAFSRLTQLKASDKTWECRQLALGDTKESTTIHVAENSFSSSLLPMLDRHVAAAPDSAYVRTQTINVERLDTLRPDLLKDEDQVCLKVDVQGYEMQVLQGATDTLRQVQIIETELSLIPLYEGQPLFREMIDYLYALGFDLVRLETVFTDPQSGYALQVDGTFVRRPLK